MVSQREQGKGPSMELQWAESTVLVWVFVSGLDLGLLWDWRKDPLWGCGLVLTSGMHSVDGDTKDDR